jgi:hypothetical protein
MRKCFLKQCQKLHGFVKKTHGIFMCQDMVG